MTSPQIHVCVQDATAKVRIQGRATCMLGPGLRAFILRSVSGGVRHFEIGLDACEYMDSTILGTLAMLAMGKRDDRWSVELLNTPPRILDQLTEMGLRPSFSLVTRPLPSTEAAMTPMPAAPAADLAGTVREAHVTLGRIDPANVTRFGGVLEALDDESARKEGNT
jgi:anti-anti-sigma regulatory factor